MIFRLKKLDKALITRTISLFLVLLSAQAAMISKLYASEGVIKTSTLPISELKNHNSFSEQRLQFATSLFNSQSSINVERGSRFSIAGYFEYSIYDNLRFKVAPVLLSSNVQSFSRDGQGTSGTSLAIDEAIAQFELTPNVVTQVGALKQDRYFSGYAVTASSFPGVGAIFSHDFYDSKIRMNGSLQGSLPPIDGTAQTDSDLNVPPTLLSQEASISYIPNSSFEAKIHISHFAFNNLNSSSAQKSLLEGNSVQRYSTSSADYLYKYDGIESGLNLTAQLSQSLSLSIGNYAIINRLAASARSKGNISKFEPTLRINKNNSVQIMAAAFNIESDATVGQYADNSLSRPNRSGTETGISLLNKNFNLSLTQQVSKVMIPSAFQNDERQIQIKLESNYVEF
jgi:hypothetical protein